MELETQLSWLARYCASLAEFKVDKLLFGQSWLNKNLQVIFGLTDWQQLVADAQSDRVVGECDLFLVGEGSRDEQFQGLAFSCLDNCRSRQNVVLAIVKHSAVRLRALTPT